MLKVVTESKLAVFWQGIKEKLASKSDTGHKHSAADVTSGILSVARGGTGASTVDATPTSGSTKMVTSGGVYAALAANAYTHPTTSGNKHIPSGGASGQILEWSADGTAQWVDAVPSFNLTSLGLSVLTPGGSAVTLTTDTTAIRTAMEKGAVEFGFQFLYGTSTLNGTAVVAPLYLAESNEYQGVFMGVVSGVPMCASFSISTTSISARALLLVSEDELADATTSIVTASFNGLGWNSLSDGTYQQTLNFAGVTADSLIIVKPSSAYESAWTQMGCKATAQGSGTVTFICNDPQDVDMPVEVVILK